MAEILVKAIDAFHPDPTKDLRGCYKRGHPVVVMPDGHPWGAGERLPLFVVVKVPLISVEQIQKYTDSVVSRRRRWRIRWADLPGGAKLTLNITGELTIKATASYTGPFDYTWEQVKAYFRNDETGLDEMGSL